MTELLLRVRRKVWDPVGWEADPEPAETQQGGKLAQDLWGPNGVGNRAQDASWAVGGPGRPRVSWGSAIVWAWAHTDFRMPPPSPRQSVLHLMPHTGALVTHLMTRTGEQRLWSLSKAITWASCSMTATTYVHNGQVPLWS